MDAGVRVAEAHHPSVVGAGDRRLAELARLEEEHPVLARLLVARLEGGGHAHELFLGGPEHLAEDTGPAGLLVCELPDLEEVPEVGGGTDQEVEVARVVLDVMKPGEGERDDHGVRVVVGCAPSGESGRDLGKALGCGDELDLDDARRDCGRERAVSTGLGDAVVRHVGVGQRVQGAAEDVDGRHRDPCFRGR